MALERLLRARLLGITVQGDCGPLTIYKSQRGRHVFFDRAPPLVPASTSQAKMRQRFRVYGADWQNLTPTQRQRWQALAHKGSCKMTGYNLFTWWRHHQNDQAIDTLIKQTGGADPR